MACDATHLYVWRGHCRVLEKVGSGLQGTVSGTVYERCEDIFKAIAAFKGEDDVAHEDILRQTPPSPEPAAPQIR